MHVPSRLNEYPVGMVSPTTDLAAPAFSSLAMIRGSTDSDDEVPSTISSSSLISRMNFKMLKRPTNAATPPRTTRMNNRQVR